MSPIALSLIAFVCTGVLVILVGVAVERIALRRRLSAAGRLHDFDNAATNEAALAVFKETFQSQERDGSPWLRVAQRLSLELSRANLNCSVGTFLLVCLVCGAAFGLLACLLSPIAILPFGLVGALIPVLALVSRRNARDRELAQQLPEVFRLIGRAVRSGQTVTSSLKMIADDFPDPIAGEFALCYEQQDRGISKESALRKLAERTGVMELKVFVVALLVQSRSGGDLPEVLDNLSSMVEKRFRLQTKVRAMTAEGRMQALVLLVLPLVTFAAVYFLSPDYASVLLERPPLLFATGALQLLGTLWICRIVNFEF